MNKKAFFFLIVLAIIQAIWIFNSDGFYYIDDSFHYNVNRHFLTVPEAGVSSWARIGRVLLFFIPSKFGYKGVQIFSGLLFLLVAYAGYKILDKQNVKYAEWVIPLIGFQPVLFNLSYTAMAEMPAAALIIFAYYFYLKDKPAAAMILSSMTFIFRTEMYFVSGIFLLIYLYKKKYISLLYFTAGPVFWFIASWIVTGDMNIFFYNLGMHSRLPRIAEGIKWYHYLYMAPKTYGVVQTLFFIIGFFLIPFSKKYKEFAIPVLIILGGIAGHTLAAIDGLSSTCSVGQVRYISIVGPTLALVATFGLGKFYELTEKYRINILFMIFFLAVSFVIGPYSTPFHTKYDIHKISEDIVKLRNEKYPDYVIISEVQFIAIAMDEAASGDKNYIRLTNENLQKYPKAIIVWEGSLDGSPFTEGVVNLKDITSLPNVRQIDSVYRVVNHNFDAPVYKHYAYLADYWKKFIDYLIAEQNCWENINLKVFIKD